MRARRFKRILGVAAFAGSALDCLSQYATTETGPSNGPDSYSVMGTRLHAMLAIMDGNRG
jgi:hypothetical protein